MQVLNIGDRTGSARVYAVDGTTGQTSGAVYRSGDQPRRDVGAWIKLADRVVTLRPHTRQTISFTVRVPGGAFGGQHLGGIVVQPATAAAQKTVRRTRHAAFRISIRELSIVAVLVNLPGATAPRLALSGLRPAGIPGRQSVLIGLSNPGNVLVKGRGSLTVVNSSGKPVEHQRFALDTLVSHTQISYPVYRAGRSLPNGRYRGTVAIVYDGRRLVRSFPFTIDVANQTQVFGAPPGTPGPPPSSSSVLLYVLLGVAVALLAAIAIGVYRLLWARGVSRQHA